MPIARSRDAEIYYEVRGDRGPALVLIRGFASPLSTWNGIDRALSEDHRVIVLDNRGVGRSSSPRGFYTADAMADDVTAVIEAVGASTVHVAGVSLGGMIAQHVALRLSDRVESLFLASTTPGAPAGIPLRKASVMTLAVSSVLPARIRGRVSAFATLSREVRRQRPELTRKRTERIRAGTTPIRGLLGQAGAVFRHNIGEALRELHIPTMVVHGAQDRLIDYRNGEILATQLPDARFELWDEHGHDLTTEAPRRLTEGIRSHVNDTITGRLAQQSCA